MDASNFQVISGLEAGEWMDLLPAAFAGEIPRLLNLEGLGLEEMVRQESPYWIAGRTAIASTVAASRHRDRRAGDPVLAPIAASAVLSLRALAVISGTSPAVAIDAPGGLYADREARIGDYTDLDMILMGAIDPDDSLIYRLRFDQHLHLLGALILAQTGIQMAPDPGRRQLKISTAAVTA